MTLNINEIICRVKLIEKDKLKAIITLDFGDFAIKGFRVTISQFANSRGKNLWIQPPSYKAGKGYFPIFFIHDKDMWVDLQEKIYDAYDKKLAENIQQEEAEQWV